MYNDDSFGVGYAVGRDSTNGNNNNGFGDSWAWWIVILLIFGWGGFGNGFGGFGNRGGSMLGYDLGKLATTNDVASGFNNSAVLSSLNDIKLGQANIQQTLCQGFNGVNTSILTSANDTLREIANLGYQLQQCCCDMKSIALENRYLNEKQTCDLITNQNANTQRIIDFLTQDKIATLQSENQTLKFQASQSAQNAFITANQDAQTAELIRRLGRDCPVPAFVVPNPNCCYGNAYGTGYGNSGCGCGCN